MRFILFNITGIDKKSSLYIAVLFYLDILMKRYDKEADYFIDIEIKKVCEDKGLCFSEDIGFYPKYFTIVLKDDIDLFHSLAHEMVHIKQYITGDYCSIIGNDNIAYDYWQGRKYIFEAFEDPYYDAPWEIEAIGRAYRLYDLWLDYKKENKL